MDEQPARKHSRLECLDYSSPGAYFITICIDGRKPILWNVGAAVVGHMKRWVSMQIGQSIWQKSFYDHGIRNQQDYNEIWEYIENNPLKYTLKRTP